MTPNIFNYTNFRIFLKDSYVSMKENRQGFSHRMFAKKAGLSSPSCLHKVINGDRNLSKDSIQKFSIALGLSKQEQQYFNALVSFNTAKTPEAKRYYLELLNNLRKRRAGEPLTDEKFEYCSNWFYPAVRELVALPDFSENPAWIRARLGGKISSKQALDAIAALERLGMISRDENGRYQQTDKLVTTDDDVAHTAACFFHQQVLHVANDTIFVTPPDQREIQGITMAVSKRQFKEIQNKMREFYDNIMNYLEMNADVPEDVMQMHMMCFPVTAGLNGGAK